MASQAKVQALYEAVCSSPFMDEYLGYSFMAEPWLLRDEDIDKLILLTKEDSAFALRVLEQAPRDEFTPELFHTIDDSYKANLHAEEEVDRLNNTELQSIEQDLRTS